MVLYILKSSFCLAILLVAYHLFLEKEKMHQFNRFYLLGSILFSFLAPTFIIYTSPSETEAPFSVVQQLAVENNLENSINFSNLIYVFYGIIATIFFIRFVKNVLSLIQKIKSNTKITYKNATLVLLSEKLIPHTFLSYIFINKREFQLNKLEKELFKHELTHVREKHTIDILIVELLQIICWFNPLLIYLKRAIKLNHEFIADSNVIKSYNNTIEYQHLLLSKVSQNQYSYLASNFNYLLTKKRLEMMTKQSSQLKMLLKKIAIIPLVIVLLFVSANRVEAKENGLKPTDIPEIILQEKVTPKMIVEYNSLAKKYNAKTDIIFKYEEIKRLKYIYSLMSDTQKKAAEKFPNIPPPPPTPAPNKDINKSYIDSNGNKIFVGKRIPNSPISEKEERHPTVLNYTNYAYKFGNLQTQNDLDFKKLIKLYNAIPQSHKASLITPNYILNNKEIIKETTKGYKNK